MPLSAPEPREALHTRRIHCQGYCRDDGLWDIEAHLTDAKSYAFSNHDRGTIEAGEPVHEMWLRVTVDDDLVIHAVEAHTDHGPHNVCPEITANYGSLSGLKIGPGWRRHVNQRVGGVLGCTHLRELLATVATTAFQTILPIKARERGQHSAAVKRAPILLGSCHAYAPSSPVVARLWPAHYTGKPT
ncbi:MAG: DUF2889 domain-containing protein [Gammaproteobacteria bacterium]|nr:DUF2889 domain-containing protein [Gammaproteobacteria bacterium]